MHLEYYMGGTFLGDLRKFYKTAARSTMLYSSECWTIKKNIYKNKVDVADMRTLSVIK